MSKINNWEVRSAVAVVDDLPADPVTPRTTPVGFCPMCYERAAENLFTVPDRLHKTPGVFTYRRCRSCRTVFQDPRIIAEDLALCYPKNYYTHVPQTGGGVENQQADGLPAQQAATRGLGGIRDKLREAIKAKVQGRPLPGVWGKIGNVLALSPRLRTRAFHGLVGDDFLPRTPHFLKALDVGCGAGRRMIELQKVWEVEGVEWDQIAAETARQISGCTVWLGDFRQLDLPLGTYGLVLLHHVFEHLDDPIASLRRIKDLLAPGGRAVLVYPNPEALGARVFGGAWYPWEVPRHLVLPSARALTKAARQIGFASVCWRTSAKYSTEYFAHSRAYRGGRPVNEFRPDINARDRILEDLERILVGMKIQVGEEITVVLERGTDTC